MTSNTPEDEVEEPKGYTPFPPETDHNQDKVDQDD